MSELRKILSCNDGHRKFDGTSNDRVTRYLHDLLRTDLADDPRYRDQIVLASNSIRENVLAKWEDTRNAYHIELNPPTATLCPLVGPDMGHIETIGLRQLVDFLLRQESKVG